jgi:hypothetical protein
MAALKNFPITGFATVLGSELNKIVAVVNNLTGFGTPGPVAASTISASGLVTLGATSGLKLTPQALTATGTTQLGAAAITAALAIITVATTASTHGVRLPVAATGIQVEVGNAGAFGVKVWPATGDKIGAASTNAADGTVLAVNKVNVYTAVNTTSWIVNRGA